MYQPEVLGVGESIPPPRPVRELTLAESTQLSMDCAADPEAFDQLQTFCGKYIDERHALEKLFATHDDRKKELALADADYKLTWQTFDPKECTPIGRAALKAAGQSMREAKDDRRQDTDLLYLIANRFSATLAEFCQEKLGRARLLLMGIEYEYDHGYLAATVPGKPIPKPVIFGDLDAVKARNLEQIPLCPSIRYDPTKTLVIMAKDEDWVRLLASLDSIAKF